MSSGSFLYYYLQILMLFLLVINLLYYVELLNLTKVILVLFNDFNEVQFFVNSIEVHRLHGSTAHIGVDD